MKKQYLLMAVLAFAVMFTFNACSEDEKKDEPEDIITVDEYDELIRGAWKDDNSTLYFCDDHTVDILFDNGSTGSGTWYFEGDQLTADGFTYTVEFKNEDLFTMTSNGSETVYTANKISNDGCYEPPMGSVVFYLTSDCGCGHVTVSINGSEEGSLSSFFPEGEVDCGTDGALTLDLEPGEYDVYAECEGLYWEFTTTVTDGGCTEEELGCSKAFAK